MGAITKEATIVGRTVGEAFRQLQEEDRVTKGEGPDEYDNGGWHNHHGNIRVITDRKEWDRIIREQDVTKHGPVYAFQVLKPIENTMKVKTDVIRYPNKGVRRWKTVYVAVPMYGASEYPRVGIMEEKQADAVAKARAYVEKNPNNPLKVNIGKILDTNGGELVAEIKYKKSSKERDGSWNIIGQMPY